jgi:hypothetical protein
MDFDGEVHIYWPAVVKAIFAVIFVSVCFALAEVL